MAFHEVRFPTDISYGSSGGPEFSTDVIITHGGFEQRNVNWVDARAKYNVAHGVKTETQLTELIAFFRARQGRAYGFRFKDWADYSAVGQSIGLGNGAETQFQLIKTYSSGSVDVVRNIKKPVAGNVKVYANGVLQNSGWAIDNNSGLITFSIPPVAEAALTADYEFDVPVRFDTDKLSARFDDYGVNSWTDIPLIEVRV